MAATRKEVRKAWVIVSESGILLGVYNWVGSDKIDPCMKGLTIALFATRRAARKTLDDARGGYAAYWSGCRVRRATVSITV